MTIGIVAEGVTDQMVIRNMLFACGIEKNQVRFIRPELSQDATDGYVNMTQRQFGRWSNARIECINKKNVSQFFDNVLEEARKLIMQIDSDVYSQYDVQTVIPINNNKRITEQRKRLITKIKHWLNSEYEDRIIYAISISTMDAWILTLDKLNPNKDTSFITQPEKDLENSGNKYLKNKLKSESYKLITDPFSKKKILIKALEKNYSLKLFLKDFDINLIKETNK